MARPKRISVVVTRQIFRCFETEPAVVAWLAARASAETAQREAKDHPCADCCAEYRDQMMLAGRCAHPETVFIDDAEGGEIGVNALDTRWRDLVRCVVEDSVLAGGFLLEN